MYARKEATTIDIRWYEYQCPKILRKFASLSNRAADFVRGQGDVQIWDGKTIESLLVEHPDVVVAVAGARDHRLGLTAQLDALVTEAPRASSHAERFATELQAIVPGRANWQEYERVCTRFLTELFWPQLGAPETQSRSEDGLDIMDAIFPIRSRNPPWLQVRSEYHSRFVVAEYKNYQEPIGQKQVESIAQYLWKKAFRSFGLLLSRKGPDTSALVARRRAWVEQDKLIVFLCDDDLIDMARHWDGETGPYDVIEAQIEDFFRTLSP